MGKLLSKFAVIGALLVMSSSGYATQSHTLELKGESVCVEHQDYTINMKVSDDWSLESFDAEDNEFTGEWTKVPEELPLFQFDVTDVENYEDCHLMFDPEYRAQYIEQGMTFQEESMWGQRVLRYFGIAQEESFDMEDDDEFIECSFTGFLFIYENQVIECVMVDQPANFDDLNDEMDNLFNHFTFEPPIQV